jgi:hypothetical protein
MPVLALQSNRFEAAWKGDLEKIKSVILSSWADGTEPPCKHPPIYCDSQEMYRSLVNIMTMCERNVKTYNDLYPQVKLAVSDNSGNNPFSLAFLRGHFDVAKGIIGIVQAQWSPEEENKARYRMARDSNEDDDYKESNGGSDNGDPGIDNIGQVSMRVQSHVLPAQLMGWNVPTFKTSNEKVLGPRGREFLGFSIKTNGMKRFKFLVENEIYCTAQATDSPKGRQ